MAGYVAVKLMKGNPDVKLKRKLFVKTLQRMKALEQPGEPESLSEYTTLWMELIDRGGGFTTSIMMFFIYLLQSIEMILVQCTNCLGL